eukprot:scaffold107722_cov26-Tisochrysis_lutea.AAC.1
MTGKRKRQETWRDGDKRRSVLQEEALRGSRSHAKCLARPRVEVALPARWYRRAARKQDFADSRGDVDVHRHACRVDEPDWLLGLGVRGARARLSGRAEHERLVRTPAVLDRRRPHLKLREQWELSASVQPSYAPHVSRGLWRKVARYRLERRRGAPPAPPRWRTSVYEAGGPRREGGRSRRRSWAKGTLLCGPRRSRLSRTSERGAIVCVQSVRDAAHPPAACPSRAGEAARAARVVAALCADRASGCAGTLDRR